MFFYREVQTYYFEFSTEVTIVFNIVRIVLLCVHYTQ